MKKLVVLCFLNLFICVFLAGCLFGNNSLVQSKNDYPVTVNDVKLSKQPEKVVVLSDSLADIIIAQGYEVQLVARADECSQEEIALLESVGSKSKINIEKIKSFSPDLILDDYVLSDEQRQELISSKINIITLEIAHDRNELENLYVSLGKIFKGQTTGTEKGLKTINNVLRTLDDINRIVPSSDVIVTACYIYADGSFATGDMISGQLLELAGALNIGAGDSDGEIDFEALALSNPNYIFYSDKFNISKLNANLKDLNAITNNHLYSMEDSMMIRQGKSMIEAVSFMTETIFPQISSSKVDKIEVSYNDNNSTKNSNIVSTNNQSSNNNTSSKSSSTSQQSSNNKNTININLLTLGSSNDDILKLQKRLDDLNYMPIKPNGTFDNRTVRAITDFQFINKLPATGELNKKTFELLLSSNAKPRPDYAREK